MLYNITSNRQAMYYEGGTLCQLLMCDIYPQFPFAADGLKKLNETFGLKFGEKALDPANVNTIYRRFCFY